MKKRLISWILTACMLLGMAPTVSIAAGAADGDGLSGNCGENLTWSFDESSSTLTISGTGEMETFDEGSPPWGRLNVEKVIIENGVTSVAELAFSWNENLKSVSFPDTLISIGDHAFDGCSNLSDLILPNGLKSIGSMAFWNCDSLSTIYIPQSVTNIGDVAFTECSALTTISVDKNNSKYCSVDGVLYSKDQTILECYPAGKSGASYTIASNVTQIMNFAFWECHQLQNIYVDSGNLQYSSRDGIVYSKDGTILDICPPGKAGSYNIPDNVNEIAATAFYSSKLENITLPESVKRIGQNAFERSYELTSVNIPSGITEISDYLFWRCEKLEEITIPTGVTQIGEYAFSGTAIREITIPAQVTRLKCCTFYDCPNLVNVTIPNSVTYFEEGVFLDCSHLTNIYYSGNEDKWNAIKVDYYDNGEIVTATIGELNEFLPGVTIHYNSDGSEAPDPTLPGQITGVLPGNRSTDTISYNFTGFHIGFDKDVAQSSKTNYASLDFSAAPFSVYRSSDDQLIYQVKENNDGYSLDVLSYESSSPDRIIIQPTNAQSLLEKDTEYYITMGEGFVQFKDGTSSTAIEKGAWTFRTAPDYPGIVSLMSEPIVRNGNGDFYLPVLITDTQNKPLSNRNISWEYIEDSHNNSFDATTDENGVAILGPLLYQNGENRITITADIPDLGKIRKTLTINCKTDSLSFEEVFELDLGMDISLLSQSINGKAGGGQNNKIYFKYIVDNGEITLEVSRERKRNSAIGATSNALWQGGGDFKIKTEGVNASLNLAQDDTRTLRIRDFDADNPKHIALVGYYILDLIASNNDYTSATIYKVLQAYGQRIFGNSIDAFTKQKYSISQELGAGASVAVSAPILGSFSAEAFDRSTKYEQSVEYDSDKNELTTSASIANTEGNLIISGDWLLGVIGSTIFAENLNKSTSEVAVVTDGDTGKRSIKLESSDKNYDGIAGTEVGNKTKETVIYSEEMSTAIGSIIDTTPFLHCLDNESFAMLTPNFVEQIYNTIYEKNPIGSYTQAKIFNFGFDLSGGFDQLDPVKISFSAKGDKHYEADVATGAVYAGKAYLATDSSSSINSNMLESQGMDLSNVLALSVQGLGAFMIESIVDTAGQVVDGVVNGIAQVGGAVQNGWYVILSRVSGENQDTKSRLSRGQSVSEQSSDEESLQFVAKGRNGVTQTISAVSDPYIVQVYTDSSKSTEVSDAQLKGTPLTITFAHQQAENIVDIYKWDNVEQIYIPATDVTVNTAEGTVSGALDANTEYILGVVIDSDTDDSGTSSGGSSSGGGSSSTGNTPFVSVNGSGGKVSASSTGTVTITPDKGYQIGSISVNGEQVAIPADSILTGLDSNDKVVVTFERITNNTGLPFVDVSSASWYAEAVQYVYENGMMNGTSETMFSPDATTTRAMIVTILHRLENEPPAEASSFTDVASGLYYADAVAWAAANGIINGVSETSFAPDDAITREQMAAILYRYAQFKGYDTTVGGMSLSEYADAPQISAYATTAMQWANAEGLITGVTDTTLSPQGSATRAQVATILMRFVENIAK